MLINNRHVTDKKNMALRLSQWLGSTPELWLRMQHSCDLWQAGKTKCPKVKPLRSRATTSSSS